MKNLIYKMPLISVICIDLIGCCLSILILKYNFNILFIAIFPILALTSKKILKNAIDIEKSSKILIIAITFITIIVLVVFYCYITVNKIINNM